MAFNVAQHDYGRHSKFPGNSMREACIRCPMLHVDPTMVIRLDEIAEDLLFRRQHAETEGWLGEIEGLELTLPAARPHVPLPMPGDPQAAVGMPTARAERIRAQHRLSLTL
ncbi:hypothetical protein ACFXO9_24930 [Nocardia tengchongensis]|uniref:hypothetical protein n=1 Tax=Nocardia tengchongensis TaxID=2055889 RepID=UPI0036896057